MPVNSLSDSGSGGNQSVINIVLEICFSSNIIVSISFKVQLLSESVIFNGFIGIGSICNQSRTEPVIFKKESESSPVFSVFFSLSFSCNYEK